MSIEALAYAKSIDLGEAESAPTRLLLYVLAENTFNDSFVCRLDQQQLAYEAGRVSERSVRRYLDALEQARVIIRTGQRKRSGSNGQMMPDAIRIAGFKRWYWRDHASQRRRAAKSPPAKLAGGENGGAAAVENSVTTGQSGRWPAANRSPVASGQLLSGAYKDNRTSKSVPLGAGAPSEDFNFDLEGKAVRDRLHHRFGEKIHSAWFARMAVSPGDDSGTAVAVVPNKFIEKYLSENYADALLAAARAVWPETQRVALRTDETLGKPARAA